MKKLLDLVKELSFVRTAGSQEEKDAAALIQGKVNAMAGEHGLPEARLMPFALPWARLDECRVEAMGRELPCAAFRRSGSIDRTLRLLWLDSAMEADFVGLPEDLSNCAVLLNGMDEDAYKRLAARHTAAFLIPKGKFYQSVEESSLYHVPLREHFARHGAIPGFIISGADAIALVKNRVSEIRLTLRQEDVDLESQNVEAVIEGTENRKESLILTAHYDSVPVGTGAWDNATGAVSLLDLYRHFAANRPKRTLRFLWCGSEEVGLCGSKAYVEQNAELLEELQLCFNFDMCGTALGPNSIVVTGDAELERYAEQYVRQKGYAAQVSGKVHSSDSASFADKGVPGLGLLRGSSTAEIHTIRDLADPLDEDAFRRNMDFAAMMIGDLANSALMPVKKAISDERKKELDKYFHRDKEEKKA